ncbi:MAG: hypothetical protein U0232_14740 [Thermomicrobiales bacterium]
MERQRIATTPRRERAAREREMVPEHGDPALVARYERLLAALEREAATRVRDGLATRLGRGHLSRPGRA